MRAVRNAAPPREHEDEPQFGLPEVLPAQEKLLWQGSPEWKAMARDAFHIRKLALYFALMIAVRLGVVVSQGGAMAEVLRSLSWTLPLAVLGLALVAVIAWLSARGTVYTITDRRIVMRIGIVLTVTFNLPYKHIQAAGLHLARDGTADLPLTLAPHDHIAWLHLWPHVRPWKLAHPQPMLRCVSDGQQVARILALAWSSATGQASTAVQAPREAASDSSTRQPAFAGH